MSLEHKLGHADAHTFAGTSNQGSISRHNQSPPMT